MAALTRVLVLDDHPVVAQGTADTLTKGGFDVVGTAPNIDEGIALIIRLQPDIVVCDVMFNGEPRGLDLVPRLHALGNEAAVILLSSFDSPYFVTRAVRDGASGYISKSAPVQELLSAVRSVADGRVAFTTRAIRTAATHVPPTPRELEVISHVATGIANGEIGLRMGLSERTIESHLAELFVRYSVASRTQLAMYALEQGWLANAHPKGTAS